MAALGRPMKSNPMRSALFAAWILFAVVVALAFFLDHRIWALDASVIGLVMGGVYLLRRTLNLTLFIFILIVGVGLAHSFAVTGLYGMSFFGVEYDSYIHTYATIVLGIASYHYMRKFRVSVFEAAAVGLLLTMGLGLLNEFVEFAGYRIGGRGEGLFLLGPGDIGAENAFENLMTDFLHDFYGGAVGVSLSLLWHVFHRRGRRTPDSASHILS